MKVCTDACVFGAWLASRIVNHRLAAGAMLDLGTGTGLLSLMMAQQSSGRLTAVEIDANAFEQAAQNFRSSPWAERLTAIHADIRTWVPPHPYDLVFSNPPFYERDLPSVSKTRNIALHATALSLEELMRFAKSALSSEGRLAVMLPFRRAVDFEVLARESGCYPIEQVILRQTPRHAPFRVLYLCKMLPGMNFVPQVHTTELILKKDERHYTDAFRDLLQDYYLRL